MASLESALEESPLYQGGSQSCIHIGITRGTSKIPLPGPHPHIFDLIGLEFGLSIEMPLPFWLSVGITQDSTR